ncbi:hypothetical protein GCK72_016242 [Caenorhabditis remanei]|uniref:mRNA-decapping enzyme C-terminal domain-containing protein n=1 Tax=Caenorhabditis remanei TaxID=31234 RepID=A0A6A5GYX1_CAERE|nr:hypothetical protein GCK72_016242 [Caenorhabditis remanei]KAF1759775.1 hypothetical protein GCK72_016242 [Caenorhabditis remanei]
MNDPKKKAAAELAAKNLQQLQKIDIAASKILDKMPFTVKKEWRNADCEGTLFVYQRADRPYFSFLIANRNDPTDFIEPLTSNHILRLEGNFIYFQKDKSPIQALWFHEATDTQRIYNLLQKLVDTLKASTTEQARAASAAGGAATKASAPVPTSAPASSKTIDLLQMIKSAQSQSNSVNVTPAITTPVTTPAEQMFQKLLQDFKEPGTAMSADELEKDLLKTAKPHGNHLLQMTKSAQSQSNSVNVTPAITTPVTTPAEQLFRKLLQDFKEPGTAMSADELEKDLLKTAKPHGNHLLQMTKSAQSQSNSVNVTPAITTPVTTPAEQLFRKLLQDFKEPGTAMSADELEKDLLKTAKPHGNHLLQMTKSAQSQSNSVNVTPAITTPVTTPAEQLFRKLLQDFKEPGTAMSADELEKDLLKTAKPHGNHLLQMTKSAQSQSNSVNVTPAITTPVTTPAEQLFRKLLQDFKEPGTAMSADELEKDLLKTAKPHGNHLLQMTKSAQSQSNSVNVTPAITTPVTTPAEQLFRKLLQDFKEPGTAMSADELEKDLLKTAKPHGNHLLQMTKSAQSQSNSVNVTPAITTPVTTPAEQLFRKLLQDFKEPGTAMSADELEKDLLKTAKPHGNHLLQMTKSAQSQSNSVNVTPAITTPVTTPAEQLFRKLLQDFKEPGTAMSADELEKDLLKTAKPHGNHLLQMTKSAQSQSNSVNVTPAITTPVTTPAEQLFRKLLQDFKEPGTAMSADELEKDLLKTAKPHGNHLLQMTKSAQSQSNSVNVTPAITTPVTTPAEQLFRKLLQDFKEPGTAMSADELEKDLLKTAKPHGNHLLQMTKSAQSQSNSVNVTPAITTPVTTPAEQLFRKLLQDFKEPGTAMSADELEKDLLKTAKPHGNHLLQMTKSAQSQSNSVNVTPAITTPVTTPAEQLFRKLLQDFKEPGTAMSADELEKDILKTAKPHRNHLLQDFANSPSAISLAAISTRSVHGSEGDQDVDVAEGEVLEPLDTSFVVGSGGQTPVLNKEQFISAIAHLMQNDDEFVAQIHQAYIGALNRRLNID